MEEVEMASFEIGGEAEVVEVAKAAGHALGRLEDAIDGFDGRVSQAGFHKGEDAAEMMLDSACQFAKGVEAGTCGPP